MGAVSPARTKTRSRRQRIAAAIPLVVALLAGATIAWLVFSTAGSTPTLGGGPVSLGHSG